MTQWYYSDYQRQRHGPVSADDLTQLHAAGQLPPDTLVWREGLESWRPWSEVIGEVIAGAGRPAVDRASFATASTDIDSSGGNPYALAEPRSPYAPPQAAVETGPDYHGGGAVVYAGFWKRAAASFIDSFLLAIVFGILGAILGVAGALGGGASRFSSAAGVGLMVGFYLVEMAAIAVYYAWFHASAGQATPGKMAIGIKVTDDDGHPITFARGIGRYFAMLLSSLTLCIGFVMAAFTDRKRALHDMVASTLVVDRWAYTGHPDRQRPELGTVTTVILVIGGLIFLVYVGVLIAVGVGLAHMGR